MAVFSSMVQIFLVLPNRLLNQVGALLKSAQSSTGESGLRRYTARRVRQMSEAFSDLYTTVDCTLSVRHNEENITQVFDRAADLVCCRCKNKNDCWNGSYLDTLTVFNDVSALINANGILRRELRSDKRSLALQVPRDTLPARRSIS